MRILDRIEQRMALPGDSEFVRAQKILGASVILCGSLISITNAIPMLYYGLDSVAILFGWVALYFIIIDIVILSRPRSYDFLARLTLLVLVAVFSLGQVLYGGFASGMSSVHWNIIIVVAAVLFFGLRFSLLSMILFFLSLVVVILLEPLSVVTGPHISMEARQTRNMVSLGSMGLVIFLGALFLVNQLELYRRRANDLLLNVLPLPIAARLKGNPQKFADGFNALTVMFVDMVGFTPLSEQLTPQESVDLLNEVFTHFDSLVEKYDVEKIRTTGDGYMVAAGVPLPRVDHPQAMVSLALDMQQYMMHRERTAAIPLQIRIGINSGSAVAGIIGTTKFQYDLWGDMVNTASRMESHGQPGKIQIARPTYELIKEEFHCEPQRTVNVKGKGEMEVWFVTGARDAMGAKAN
ncbi:MAG: adenylate/guanylate cyclase domain-containing protein [Candidatus Promineifilaceae bacterium]|nr:adenylate/guanylate cyclase domain-containing protein [Candidatus Promineifilaceae bacterium]